MYRNWAEDRLEAKREAEDYFRAREIEDAHLEYLRQKALIKGWQIIRFLYDNKVITLNGEAQIILEDGSVVSPKEGEEIVDVISEPANPEGKGFIFPYPNGEETPAFVMESFDEYDCSGKPVSSFEVYRYCADPYVYEIYGEETYAWFTSDSLHDRAMEV